MRQQFVDFRGWMLARSDEDVSEVGDRVHAVGFAGGDERVEAGDVVPGIFVPDEEEVLSSEGDNAKGGLAAVVVWRQLGIVEESVERLPVLQRVADRRAH